MYIFKLTSLFDIGQRPIPLNIRSICIQINTFHISKAYFTNLFYVSGSGDIGIGTASPASKLHIKNTASEDTASLTIIWLLFGRFSDSSISLNISFL